MTLTRRTVALGAIAVLAGCVSAGRRSGGGYSAPDAPPQPVPDAGWDAWVQGFKPRAVSRGISPGVVDAAFRGAGFLPQVIEKDRNQTEFTRTLEDYLNIAASGRKGQPGASEIRAVSRRSDGHRDALWG